MPNPANMPQQRRPGMNVEKFQAFGKADTREELNTIMRATAAAYFGDPVRCTGATIREGREGQPAYRGSSWWVPVS